MAEEFKLVKKHLPVSARETLNALHALGGMLHVYKDNFARLTARVPNGPERIDNVRKELGALMLELRMTIPDEQLPAIDHHMELTTVHIGVHSAAPRKNDFWVLSYDEAAILVDAIVRNSCFACDKKRDEECPVRDVMKNLPIQSLDNYFVGCWHDTEEE